jgi:hypothetical protein
MTRRGPVTGANHITGLLLSTALQLPDGVSAAREHIVSLAR